MYGVQSGVMLTALLSLAFVILLVLLLHVYIRLFLRRHQARRQSNSPFSLPAIYVEPPKAGLDPAVLNALPVFEYRSISTGASATDCAVCLAALEEEEIARLLPACRHVFHVDCINMWLYSHSSCPVCRAEVEAPPSVSCSAAANVQLPERDRGSIDLPAVAGEVEAVTAMRKDQEVSSSRLNLSLRRMLSRTSSQRSTAADIPMDIERAEREKGDRPRVWTMGGLPGEFGGHCSLNFDVEDGKPEMSSGFGEGSWRRRGE